MIYIVAVFVFVIGLYMVISSRNYVRKIIGLSIFQTSILIFYIALGKITGGIVPIAVKTEHIVYSSPLPHVLMLTAIVVGFSTLALALALIRKIYAHFGTLDSIDLCQK